MKKIISIVIVIVVIVLGAIFIKDNKKVTNIQDQNITNQENVINSENPTTGTSLAGQNNTEGTFTMDEVSAHNNETSCYTVIRGTVYDVSAWIYKHPGGDRNILSLCGIDGTAAFEGQHGGQRKPENILAGFEIGKLAQ